MVSLTTVYAISIVFASIAGMGSAFLGNKIYPLTGGGEQPIEEETFEQDLELPSTEQTSLSPSPEEI